MTLKKNEIYEIEINDIVSDGNGIGHIDGIAVFVPDTDIGDRALIKIVKVLSSYCFGIVEKIIEPSKNRITPDCKAYKQCGGCSLRHISYEEELRIKSIWVESNMKKIGKIDLPLEKIIPSPKETKYRNKAIYPLSISSGKVQIGFYAKRSHRIIECDKCYLHPDNFEEIKNAFYNWVIKYDIPIYDEISHKGVVRSLFIRQGEITKETLVCIIAAKNNLAHIEELVSELKNICSLSSLILNINNTTDNVILGKECITLYGNDFISDILCNTKFILSPLSFYQVNHDCAQSLYGLVKDYLNPNKNMTVIDMYCGVGTIGLSIAKDIKELIGIEIVPAAIENAKVNAQINDITNSSFICGDATECAKKINIENKKIDAIIVDPPRKGLTPDLIDTISSYNPNKVIMVSCNSATAARDINLFSNLGFLPKRICPVDMFPRTCHVETIILLEKIL